MGRYVYQWNEWAYGDGIKVKRQNMGWTIIGLHKGPVGNIRISTGLRNIWDGSKGI